MAWQILYTEDVLSEFTIQEAASIRTLQGSGSGSGFPYTNIDIIVIRVIDEVRGYISAGNYTLDVDPRKIPDALLEDAIAVARWRILVAVPMLKQLQTEERRKAYEDALKKLLLIAEGQFDIIPIDPLAIPKTGCWNSENKLIMRTHPIPTPGSQFQPQTDTYANQGSPPDNEPI